MTAYGSGHGNFVMWIDTSELEAFRVGLGRANVRIGAAGSRIIRAGALKMERHMKANAKVDTGAMRNSVSTSIIGDGRSTSIVAEIGPTVDYAIFVSEGTSKMAGDHFVPNAFDAIIGSVVEAAGKLGEDLLP